MKFLPGFIVQIFIIPVLLIQLVFSPSIAAEKTNDEDQNKCTRRYQDIQTILSKEFPITKTIFVRDSKMYEKHYVSDHQRTLIGDIKDEGILGPDSKLVAIEILGSRDITITATSFIVCCEITGVSCGAVGVPLLLGGFFGYAALYLGENASLLGVANVAGALFLEENAALLGVASGGIASFLGLEALYRFISQHLKQDDQLLDLNLYFFNGDKPSTKVVLRNIIFEEVKEVTTELNQDLTPPDPGSAPKEPSPRASSAWFY
jgi:hypothetical protein